MSISRITDLGSCYFSTKNCKTVLRGSQHIYDFRDCTEEGDPVLNMEEVDVSVLPVDDDGEYLLSHNSYIIQIYSDNTCVYRYVCLDEDDDSACSDCEGCGGRDPRLKEECGGDFTPYFEKLFCFATPKDIEGGIGNKVTYDCSIGKVIIDTIVKSEDETVDVDYDEDTKEYDLSVTHEQDNRCNTTLNDGTVIYHPNNFTTLPGSRLTIVQDGCNVRVEHPCDRVIISEADQNMCMICVDGLIINRCPSGTRCDGSGNCVNPCDLLTVDELNCQQCQNGVITSKCLPSQRCDGNGNCISDCNNSLVEILNSCVIPDGGTDQVGMITLRIQTQIGITYTVTIGDEVTALVGDGTIQDVTWQASSSDELATPYNIECSST